MTGASGFVGTVLAKQLAAQGWRITAIHRPGSNLKYLQGLPIDWRAGDVTDPASLRDALPKSVDAVEVHLRQVFRQETPPAWTIAESPYVVPAPR
ncbi:MAG: NAD(P)H-binding protein [Proteobacteria bacterium]|nr:NAD(P)H-binding protein [Pseudomonadota bacterium]MDA0983695.1 NAD(P)H-binding protein [Pseudomonadota bacterium]